jgi:hypothetical protein
MNAIPGSPVDPFNFYSATSSVLSISSSPGCVLRRGSPGRGNAAVALACARLSENSDGG